MASTTRFALVTLLVACGSPAGDSSTVDAGRGLCTGPADCDDGLFCNGAEVCMPGGPVSDERGCAPGPDPCDGGECSEESDECTSNCPDADGDGFAAAACGGSDCDDADADVFPGAVEVCDVAGRDEDCDPTSFGERDLDGDGFNDQSCCNGTTCGRDCDDARAGTNPAVPEVCDELDNDCNGVVDEGLLQSVFVDADRDLYGDPDRPLSACPGIAGTSASSLDCDDTDPFINGPQFEVSDGVDNDCDTRVDEDPRAVLWYPDADDDRYGDPTGETVLSSTVVDGHSLLANDCDDTDPAISPVAEELCNGRDDDCDGRADFVIGINDFEDDDGDGVPDAACAGVGGDCDDRDPRVFPGAGEACDNGRDDDCDGEVDEGCDVPPPEDFATDCAGGCTVPFVLGSADALDGLTRNCGDVDAADFDAGDFEFGPTCDGGSIGEIVLQDSVWHTVEDGTCTGRFSVSFDATAERVRIHSCNPERIGVGAYGYAEEAGRRFLFLRIPDPPARVTVLEIVAGDVASAVLPCATSVAVDGVCATGSVSFPPFPGPGAVSSDLRGSWLRCNDGPLSADPSALELLALCAGTLSDFVEGERISTLVLEEDALSIYDFPSGAGGSAVAEECHRPARSAAGDRLQLWNAFEGIVAVESPRLRTVSDGATTYLVETPFQETPNALVQVTLDPFTDPCDTAPPLDFSVP